MNSLAKFHSFALPAEAKQIIILETLTQLPDIVWTNDTWILGAGSNTIFTSDYSGTVLVNQLLGVHIQETSTRWLIDIAAGENWHSLVLNLVEQGIFGLENLALIPGSVGAAPVQNIGAYGVEISRYIKSVQVYNFKTHEFSTMNNADCRFAYRDSIFKLTENAHLLITSVQLELPKSWQPVLDYPDLSSLPRDASAEAIMKHVINVRNAKLPDPEKLPNAGSFFKNPIVSKAYYEELLATYPDMPAFVLDKHSVKLAAGWLIDHAGLKALNVGDAAVHQRQALVLINRGRASGNDLITLARAICTRISEKYGVYLEPEVRLLGQNGLLETL
ncbi:UDP-N-acetylenolpyruvoylglucosamine reductase [Aliidiomarina shirensis]|uniref:UDP-N-acetylenolpyruvoylglucosamine reductase n=1 Tax=Aliidiomarina shirensis TaxID=1048642 RepID=A0A432WL66_9GAMM|nr:UDP-N-acetylmuramate dehydrogenase [Aliidiomarina shirensis]RUO34429.1 UDP-N-acetylenolpyruvoylglucosamine reductase [Aliidiomarina shirensis]